MTTTDWITDYDQLTRLGSWLIEHWNFTAEELQSYYEKPWKWDDEYRDMCGMEADPPTRGTCKCGTITDNKLSGQWVCDDCSTLEGND